MDPGRRLRRASRPGHDALAAATRSSWSASTPAPARPPRSAYPATRGSASPATAARRSTPRSTSPVPRGMAGAMRNLVGIEPDYVMVTRFPFFEDMVDDIGGITVTNPRRFYDPYLKKEGFRQGRIHLDGYNAMAFSRIRKGLAGGDFDRSANQQRTLRGIHARIRAQASQPGLHRARRDDGDGAHGHQRLARRALRARAGRRPGRPPQDHHLRGPGARSASSAPRAWCSPTSPRPGASVARRAPTRPCVTAESCCASGGALS